MIASYNQARLLPRAVESVLGQTHAPIEILIADDASHDGSRDLISALENRFPAVRGILRDRNVGVARNRDLALREARGDLVTTLDADDFYLPRKIELELAALKHAPTDAIAFSDTLIATSDKGCRVIDTSRIGQLSARQRFEAIVMRSEAIPRDMLMSKRAYIEVGGFRSDLQRFEDWDLKIRLAHVAPDWKHSGECGTVYCRHSRGLSEIGRIKTAGSQWKVLSQNRTLIAGILGRSGLRRSRLRVVGRPTAAAVRGLSRIPGSR